MTVSRPRPPFSLPLARLAVLGVLADVAAAQCQLEAQALAQFPGANAPVHATVTWDPDGPGPLTERVVLGGTFQSFGPSLSPGLAVYDPATREISALGSGIEASDSFGGVKAIAVLPNHDLVVGGAFVGIDGVAATNVARWNGSTWQPLGAGIPGEVRALAVLPNGDLVAGGAYQVPLRWNGAAWQPIGSLSFPVVVRDFATLPNGDLVAAGYDLQPGEHVLRYDGSVWSPLGAGPDGDVFQLQSMPNGDLVAVGFFATSGGSSTPGIARWNGATWSGVGSGLGEPSLARAVTLRPSGDLVVGGVFTTAGGAPANQIAQWNGASWSPMAGGLGHPFPFAESILTLCNLGNGELLAGGEFLSADGAADYAARWDGSTWSGLRAGTNGFVFDAVDLPNGDRIVVGDFTIFEGVPAARVARRVGGTWQALGAGIDQGTVRAVLPLPNGDLVVAGTFVSAGGVPAPRVARWDGATWQPLGAGLTDVVSDLAFHAATGQILAAGTFLDRYAVWDGQSWSGTGVAQATPSFLASDRKLVTTPQGDVLIFLGNALSRWSGTAWTPVTTALPIASTEGPVAVLPDGSLAAATNSTVRRWDGTTWSNLPNAPFSVGTLIALPDGNLLATQRQIVPGLALPSKVARWDGTAWHTLGDASGTITRLRRLGLDAVFAMGSFDRLLEASAAGIAELVSTCPAGATSVGTGCTGSGGPNVLTAQSLTWIGSTYRSVATGMPTSGVVLEVYGLGGLSLPLATVLPQAGPGCDALATPDLLRLHLPQNGAALLELAIPNTPSFVGSVWHQQVVPFEIDALGAIVDVTASNALVHTLGAF